MRTVLKKRIIILIVILLIPLSIFFGYYFVAVKPEKDLVSKLSKEYIVWSESAYVLPIQYQNKDIPVPKDVADKFKADMEAFLKGYVAPDSPHLQRKLEISLDSIDRQISKELIYHLRSVEVIDTKDFDLQGSRASIVVITKEKESTTSFRSGVEESFSPSGEYEYKLGFVKINNKWMISSYDYRPLEF